MKNLIYGAVTLAVLAGTAPAMAQAVQSTPDEPIAAQAQPGDAVDAADPAGGQRMLLQGYGRHGEVEFHWYYVTPQFQPLSRLLTSQSFTNVRDQRAARRARDVVSAPQQKRSLPVLH